jgi:transcriptional regulator with XRE-family HTH domain
MSRSLRVHQGCIERVKLAVKRNGFPSQRALAENAGLSLATVSNFLTGKPVDRASFVELCQMLTLNCEEIGEKRLIYLCFMGVLKNSPHYRNG